jgi:predicted nuclease with TOPRIM domain
MSEDLTQNLPSRSFEERVLAELSAIRREQSAQRETLSQLDARLTSLEGRMATLEEIVDARLHDTRPMWEGVQERLTSIEKEMSGLNRHLKIFAGELSVLRNRVDQLEDDVGDLAQRRP